MYQIYRVRCATKEIFGVGGWLGMWDVRWGLWVWVRQMEKEGCGGFGIFWDGDRIRVG
jgi:hypothetical protein